jgi:hypothetical protein
MNKALSFGLVAFAFMAVGCGSEEPAKKPAFNNGALLRFVNLSSTDVHVKFGNTSSSGCPAWERTTFRRTPPKKTDVVISWTGKEEKLNLDLKPTTRYTIYAVEQGGKIQFKTIENDPQDVEESRVAFRAISFAGAPVDFVVKPTLGDKLEAKGIASGSPSSEMVSTPQTFTVTAISGGKTIGEETVEAAGGQTFTLAVTGGSKPVLKVFHNNPGMMMGTGGASPAG